MENEKKKGRKAEVRQERKGATVAGEETGSKKRTTGSRRVKERTER